MGSCCERRTQLSTEEDYIEVAQNSLNFYQHNIIAIDSSFYLHGKFYFLTKEDFQKVRSKLGLPDTEAHRKFYQKLKKPPPPEVEELVRLAEMSEDKMLFSVVSLDLLGIILGKGKISDKAGILLRNYDPNHDQRLSESELLTMVEDLLVISLDYLPYLAVELALSKSSTSGITNKLEEYKKKLITMKETMKKYFVSLLYEDCELTIDMFIERFNNPDVRRLIEARSLRTFIIQHYKEAKNFYSHMEGPEDEGGNRRKKDRPKKKRIRPRKKNMEFDDD